MSTTTTSPLSPPAPSVPCVPTIADRLEGAAALIEERGGCLCAHEDDQGRLCLVGAALKAESGDAWRAGMRWDLYAPYTRPMTRALGYDDTAMTDKGCYSCASSWNDTPGRTDAERAALLRKAAALARSAS